MSSTCTTGCNEHSHSSTCRSRQRRVSMQRDHATPANSSQISDATPDKEAIHATDSNATGTSMQRSDVQQVECDADKDYSSIYVKTKGKIKLPGDPGYEGVCKLVNGQWTV